MTSAYRLSVELWMMDFYRRRSSCFVHRFTFHDEVCRGTKNERREVVPLIPAVGFARQPFFDFR